MSSNNKLMPVQIEFDREKLSALKMYLGQKDMKIETEDTLELLNFQLERVMVRKCVLLNC